MRVEDDVLRSVVEWCPEIGTFEAVLEHYGDAGIDAFDQGEDAGDVGVDPVYAVGGEACAGAEAGEVVGGFVYGRDGEGIFEA